jgi:aryl-alcohol dehydrogenase-like predicted oxidoreductase
MEFQPKVQIPSNTKGISASAGILVFPNPASDMLHLVAAESMQISVRDALGRGVFTGKSESNGLTVDTREWPNGIYFVQGKSTSGNWTVKTLIQH